MSIRNERRRAFIGLGSNLGDSIATLCHARAALTQQPHTQTSAVSRLYRSAPIGPQDQPDFINAVIALDTELPALALLDWLQQLEQQAGRTRHRHWGERTLDLDLLLYDDQRIEHERLTVPHPRLTERAFVLQPLAEIAASLRLPAGDTVADYCQACIGQAIMPLNDRRWSHTIEPIG